MIVVPIYRPVITIYERTRKNREWAVDGWVSKQEAITNTLFYPIANGASITEAGFKKVVEHGEDPFYRIEAPDGSYLAHHGRATLLDRPDRPSTLYTPDGKAHDAINALVFAKRGACGLHLIRPGRTRPLPDPFDGIPARPQVLTVVLGPPPVGPPVPVHQLGFGWLEGPIASGKGGTS